MYSALARLQHQVSVLLVTLISEWRHTTYRTNQDLIAGHYLSLVQVVRHRSLCSVNAGGDKPVRSESRSELHSDTSQRIGLRVDTASHTTH